MESQKSLSPFFILTSIMPKFMVALAEILDLNTFSCQFQSFRAYLHLLLCSNFVKAVSKNSILKS